MIIMKFLNGHCSVSVWPKYMYVQKKTVDVLSDITGVLSLELHFYPREVSVGSHGGCKFTAYSPRAPLCILATRHRKNQNEIFVHCS